MPRITKIPLNQLDPAVSKHFSQTKMALFRMKTQGFLSALLLRLKEIVWTRDIETAAVSPTVLYWNPDFFLSSSPALRLATLAHELWHVGLLHAGRIGKRDPEVWNWAADYVINLLLDRDGFKFENFNQLINPDYAGMSTEEVYELLMKSIKELPALRGEFMTAAGGTLQQDLVPPEDQSEVLDAVSNAIAAQITSPAPQSGIGSMPGEMKLTLDSYTNPKLPFEVVLRNHFNSMVTTDYSYQRPSRRYDDPIMPGNMGMSGLDHLLYCIDISGSISDEDIVAVNSQLKHIQEDFNPERMTIITWDTKIHDVYELERDQPYHELEIEGRGGTSLTEVYEFITKTQPSVAVIFTDLDVRIPENPGVPIIWICTDHRVKEVPYGALVHVDYGA